MEAWQDDLECTICLDFSASPIQSCANGHIVCGNCFRRVKRCGMCQEQLTFCSFADRLVKRHGLEKGIQCRNAPRGCSKMIKANEMEQHLSNQCGYRKIKCPLLDSGKCSKALIHLQNLESHLQLVHGVPKDPDTQSSIFPSCSNYINSLEDSAPMMLRSKWFDGRIFFLHEKLDKGYLFQWLSVIGDNSVAEKYRFKMNSPNKIASTPANSASYSWNLPVVPIHQSEFTQVVKLGFVGSVHSQALIRFSREEKVSGQTLKYCFSVTHEIIKM